MIRPNRYIGAICFASIGMLAGATQAADILALGTGRGYNNTTRFESVLAGHSMDGARTAILADGHTVASSESFNTSNVQGFDVVFLGLFDPGVTLTSTEQTALLNFVRSGGALIYVGDNDHFASSNASIAGLFGVTYSTDTRSTIADRVLLPSHPVLAGVGGVVDSYDGSGNIDGFMGGINLLGPNARAVLASEYKTTVAVIERHALQPGSGPVVFLADANGFLDTGVGGITYGDNLALFRNIIMFVSPDGSGCLTHANCDDGRYCNGFEECEDGVCLPGSFPCPQGLGCKETSDTCGPCTADAECDDFLFCNGVEICEGGVCKRGELPCEAGQGCDERDDTCGPCGGAEECDDHIFCNGIEVCVGKECVGGSFPCHEGLGCHEDTESCGPCTNDAQCDDFLFCNGLEVCVNGACQHGSFPCTGGLGCVEDDDLCAPCGGESLCDDGVFCNGAESCVGGECEPGLKPCTGGLVCDEPDNLCRPCADDTDCDDGVFCNGAETCNRSTGRCTTGTDPCVGLICQEESDECVKVGFQIVTVAEPTSGVSGIEPPASQTRFNNGETLFAEIWAQTSHAVGLGCMYADMLHGDLVCNVDAINVEHSTSFQTAATGSIRPPALVDEFGGCAVTGNLGVAPNWQYLGRIELAGGENCETEICLVQAATPSTNFSGLTIVADQIGYDCQTIEFADCLYDLDDDNFVGPGDLGLFAACWLCCEGDECWDAGNCSTSDFDCDVCVGPGDLAYFATSWLADCVDANAILPPCQGTEGVSLPPATASEIRSFNLTQPPRGWPSSRSDWYTKLRAAAAKRNQEQK